MSKRDGGMYHARQGVEAFHRKRLAARQVRDCTRRLLFKADSDGPLELVSLWTYYPETYPAGRVFVDDQGRKNMVVKVEDSGYGHRVTISRTRRREVV